MRVAYIAGRYRAATPWAVGRNVRAAGEVALKYSKLGYAVVCPHMNTAHMDGELPDEFWLEATLELMRRCDVVVMMLGWLGSAGARAEYEEANRLGKAIVLDCEGPEHGMVAAPKRIDMGWWRRRSGLNRRKRREAAVDEVCERDECFGGEEPDGD